MPCPQTVLNATDHVVFCYTTDLKEAARYLAGILGCTMVTITCETNAKGGGIFGIDRGIPLTGKTAWLVGHGLNGDIRIGTATHSRWVDVNDVLSWCDTNGYTHVVDTCCQPDLRRQEVSRYGLAYYCVPDGHNTGVITNSTLDTWWDLNNLYKFQ